jgi:hypothetical protein
LRPLRKDEPGQADKLTGGEPHAEQDQAGAQDHDASDQQCVAKAGVADGNAKADGKQSHDAYADACGEQHDHFETPCRCARSVIPQGLFKPNLAQANATIPS